MTTYHLRATLLPDGDAPVDLWVVGGHITFEPQDDAEELAPSGGYVLPGLVDAHGHITTAGYRNHHLPIGSRALTDANRRAALARGILVLRDMGPLLRHGEIEAATLGGLDASDGLPRVHACGQMLAPPHVFTGMQRPTDEAELVAVAEQQLREAHAHHRWGAPWVKLILDNYPSQVGAPRAGRLNYSPEALAALAAATHSLGGRVAVHTFTPDGAAAAVAAGVDTLEHAWDIDEALVDRMAADGIAWTPTLCVAPSTLRVAHDDARERWIHEAMQRMRALVPYAQRRGVTLLAGTDSTASATAEVAALHAAGLEPREALAAASTAARRYLGEPGIEEGARADLVLYAGDPRSSPELLERPSVLMLDGRRIEPNQPPK